MRADKIITASDFTKRTIISTYSLPISKITVIPHGIDVNECMFSGDYVARYRRSIGLRGKGSKAWREMLVMYRRSMAETAVSVVKRRFNHMLYSRKRELRLQVLTYNLSVIARLPAQSKYRAKALIR